MFGHKRPGGGGDRVRGIIVDLRTGDHREPLVEEVDERTDQASLCLPPLSEQDHVVASEHRCLKLRQDGVLEPLHPNRQRSSLSDAHLEVGGHLGGYGPRDPPARKKLAERRRQVGGRDRGVGVASHGLSLCRRVAPMTSHRENGEVARLAGLHP